MEDLTNIRLEKLKKLEELGVETYPYEYKKTNEFIEVKEKYKNASKEDLEKTDDTVTIAGRITAIRKMGKSGFLHLFDGEEKLQVPATTSGSPSLSTSPTAKEKGESVSTGMWVAVTSVK